MTRKLSKKRSLRQSKKNNSCLICKSTDSRQKVRTDKLTVYCCTNCGLHFVPQNTTPERAGSYYKNYDQKKYIAYYRPFRKRVFKENWTYIQKLKPTGNSLDFGASFGWFLELAPKAWNAAGIEPSKAAVTYARKHNLHMRYGDENLLEKERKKYDVITLWNVIEHLSNPKNTIQTVRKKLKKGGIIGISFPNRNGLINRTGYFLYRISGGKITTPLYTLFQVGNPEPHIFHFSKKDMKTMLTDAHFKVLSVKGQPIVDIQNLSGRSELESGTIPQLKMWISNIAITVLYYASIIFHLDDELVIYAEAI